MGTRRRYAEDDSDLQGLGSIINESETGMAPVEGGPEGLTEPTSDRVPEEVRTENSEPDKRKDHLVDFVKEAEIDLQLFKRQKAGDSAAREQLILRQETRINSLARKHSKWSNGCDIEDLKQEGWIGVMKALDTFDDTAGVPFNYYAGRWSKAKMTSLIYKSGRTIRTPILTARDIGKMKKAIAQFIHEKQKEPTDAELAEIMKVPVKRVKRLRTAEVNIFSLFSPLSSENGTADFSNIVPSPSPTPEETFANTEMLNDIMNIVEEELSDNERQTIEEYFGIGGKVRRTLQEIGEDLGKTKQGIRAIRIRALKKIHDGLVKRDAMLKS
jgi:RNA polymerase sigma factor (sigma-70 family)